MEKILFILNPVAGGGRAEDLNPIILDVMKDRDLEYRIVNTRNPKDATNFAREAVTSGYSTVIAVGGDGTVNEVALGLMDSDVALGIVPGGTGNDYARTLDISLDPRQALINILDNGKRSVDVGFVNGKLFLNIASIGLDSAVVKGAEKYKEKYQSGTAYSISLIKNLLSFRKKKVEFEIDGLRRSERIYLIAVGNGKTYGGGFKILPMAKVDDGWFYICVVKKAIKPMLLLVFPSILFGKHPFFKRYVDIIKAKEFKVFTDEDMYLNVDGEIYKVENETDFIIQSEKLKISY